MHEPTSLVLPSLASLTSSEITQSPFPTLPKLVPVQWANQHPYSECPKKNPYDDLRASSFFSDQKSFHITELGSIQNFPGKLHLMN